jgi:hypothetical protein
MKELNSSLTQQAQLIALANRQRLLNREQDARIIKDAVRDALKQLKTSN